MKKCIECGRELADAAKFCTFCGKDQSVPLPQGGSADVCVKCGNILKEGALFCSACGTKRQEAPMEEKKENKCIKCGREFSEPTSFCPDCGAKQVKIYTEVFERNGLSEADFLNNINRWFQYHTKAANMKCYFDMETSLGLLANKYELNTFTVKYELFSGDNTNQYALVKEDVTNLTHQKARDFVEQWKAQRPQVTVLNWEGGTHSRGHIGSSFFGGIGAANRMNVYIFYKFPRKQA